jgi:hypothetical protein
MPNVSTLKWRPKSPFNASPGPMWKGVNGTRE